MREIRSSGSVEGVVRNHDPYSDSVLGALDDVMRCKDAEGFSQVERRVGNILFGREEFAAHSNGALHDVTDGPG